MKLKIIKAWENREQITDEITGDDGDGGIGWSMRKIAEHFGVSTRSVSRCIAKRNDLKLSNNSDEHHVDDDDVMAIQSNTHSNSEDHSTTLIPNFYPEIIYENNKATDQLSIQASKPLLRPDWIDNNSREIVANNDYHSLDEELINEINEIFDHLKRIRIISKRLSSSPTLKEYALDFVQTMLNTANGYVNRLDGRSDQIDS
ncbi:hypothetical protein BLA29_011021 [Euroglyphus maynei]|uniref:Uncharacterized protein n=1 Tax=Euroglyphus maynei TaxID=6958 RepID=A0A1Y3BBJ1_EURMA|nr:hypothetical protein BLA29_011021 [Euroglyphus maynei]